MTYQQLSITLRTCILRNFNSPGFCRSLELITALFWEQIDFPTILVFILQPNSSPTPVGHKCVILESASHCPEEGRVLWSRAMTLEWKAGLSFHLCSASGEQKALGEVPERLPYTCLHQDNAVLHHAYLVQGNKRNTYFYQWRNKYLLWHQVMKSIMNKVRERE